MLRRQNSLKWPYYTIGIKIQFKSSLFGSYVFSYVKVRFAVRIARTVYVGKMVYFKCLREGLEIETFRLLKRFLGVFDFHCPKSMVDSKI